MLLKREIGIRARDFGRLSIKRVKKILMEGLFGESIGWEIKHSKIENLILKDFDITGDHYVGSLVRWAAKTDFKNITAINSKVTGRNIVGGLLGTADRVNTEDVNIVLSLEINALEYIGMVAGSSGESKFIYHLENYSDLCFYRNYSAVGYTYKTEIHLE